MPRTQPERPPALTSRLSARSLFDPLTRIAAGWSLVVRLLVGSGLVLVAGGIAMLWLSASQDIAFYRGELASRLEDEFATLLPMIGHHAVTGDYSAIQQTVEARSHSPYVRRVEWRDGDGSRVVAESRPTRTLAPQWFVAWVTLPAVDDSRPLVIGGRHYGDLQVQLTADPGYDAIWQRLERSARVLLVAVAINFALLSWILRRSLASLSALAEGTRRLGEGDYAARVVPAGPREVQDTIDIFNRTADTLQRLNKEVAEQRRAIEAAAMLVETDLEGRITYVTDNFCELCGFSREELLGQNHRIMNSGMHPPELFRELWETLRAGRVWRSEVCNRAKDGHLFWLYSAITPFFGADGKPRKYVAIRFDITQLKEAQAALLLSKEAAEAASRAKSSFLATVSHEIRTPMNGILGMTDLMLGSKLDGEQREYLEIVKTSATGLLEIINDILDFSRIEAGRLELAPHAFALADLINDTVKPLRLGAEAKSLALDVSLGETLPPVVVADSMRLRQILVNLIGNAIKFTEQGAVALMVHALQRESDGAVLQFDVRDSGIGIDPDKQASIFESFVQADSSVSRRYGGTGLGLAISARLVGKMGGRIWVESSPGGGSTFHFTVRVGLADAAALRAAPVPAIPSAMPGEARDILVVEDNAVNQKLAVLMLDKLGHRATVADNGQAAIDALAQRNYDLVLMDMQMPVMDGLEATARLRRQGLRIPIVAMTANAMPGDRERCLASGMDDYLAKPISSERLAEVLATWLGRSGENIDE